MRLVFSYFTTHIAHYPLLHSSLITSLSLAVAPACHHMTCTYSPHKCIVIGCFIAHLILHFRASGWLPCRRGNEEDGVRVGRGGTEDLGIWLCVIPPGFNQLTLPHFHVINVFVCVRTEWAEMDEYPTVWLNNLFHARWPCFDSCFHAEEKFIWLGRREKSFIST